MKIYTFTEEQLLSVITDAVGIYKHEVIMKDGNMVRTPETFAGDYTKHLTSVWQGNGKCVDATEKVLDPEPVEDKVADEPSQATCEKKRYCGDAMLADDIARHSSYDLRGIDLHIQNVRWLFSEKDSDTGETVDVWQYDATVRYEGLDHFFTVSFREDNHAIRNSAAAFDRALGDEFAVAKDPLVRHLELKSSDVPEPVEYVPVLVEREPQRKRYSGDAMIKDDIFRHSKYDLKGVDFRIPLVRWADKVDGHDVWLAFVEFLIEGKLTESSFKFSEAGSAIDNSVQAFDRMVENSPSVFGFLKEKLVECEKPDDIKQEK